jgi:hypothetical protein
MKVRSTRTHLRAVQRLWTAVALAGAAMGCLGDQSVVGDGGPRPTNSCTRDGDCTEGVCDAERRRCVAVARAEVFFSVAPSGGRGSAEAVPTLTPPRTIGTGEEVHLALRGARTVFGAVTVTEPGERPGSGGMGPSEGRRFVPATVEFVPAGLDDVVVPTRAVASPTPLTALTADTSPYTFSALVPDGQFDVVVRPSSELMGVLPPLFQRGFEVRADATFQRFDLAYPARFSRWSGTLRDRMGNPLTGLTVRAVDLARGAMLVSTVAVTQGRTAAMPGAFDLDLAPGAPEDWALRITSAPGSESWLTLDIPRADLERIDPTGRAVRVELASDLGLPWVDGMRPSGGGSMPAGTDAPCVGCVEVRGSVEGRATSGGTRALRGATVQLQTQLSGASRLGVGVRSRFECRVTTGEDGSFRAWLVPGDYTVVVVPTQGEFGNAARTAFRVQGDVPRQVGQVFSVEPRLPLDGRALSPRGVPMEGARVTAIPFHDAYLHHGCLADAPMQVLAPRARAADALTDRDGGFRLDLDPGLYRVLVDPPEGSGYAATLGAAVCVTSRVRAYDVTLDAPLQVQGTVRDAVGRPAPQASVEALVRVREPGAPGVVVRVARGSADAEGRYTVLLPVSAGGA